MSNTIDFCQTGYDYEQFLLNELENENMKLKKKLEIATKALKRIKMRGRITQRCISMSHNMLTGWLNML